jgi:long-chain acyl-CoA synthetase
VAEDHRLPIVEGYGLSETSPVATANRLDNTEFNGSIGYPLPSTEVAILDDDGNHLPIGGVAKSPSVVLR